MQKIEESVWIAPGAQIYGVVEIGAQSSIWPNAVIRSEAQEVRIGRYTNVQDFVMIHVGYDDPTQIGDFCSITHHATVHGAVVEDECLIGIGATIMDGARIGRGSIVAGGALVHLRPGDAVAVEDPGYASVLDLVAACALRPLPVALDDDGPLPESLASALAAGAAAFVFTPRAQNPTGAALTPERGAVLEAVLADHPDVLVVSDDHAAEVAGAEYRPLGTGQRHFAAIRSLAKAHDPDLRLALIAADIETLDRVEGRQALGPGWASGILQRMAVHVLSGPSTAERTAAAATHYRGRREALIAALAERGVPASGASGLNVWVPAASEDAVTSALAASGYAVRSGERYRLSSGAGIRITISSLDREHVEPLAAAIADAVTGSRATRAD